jgi:type 1 fimbriae regulatory protein FimB/type 1 fimbriae regulatory protein FimE
MSINGNVLPRRLPNAARRPREYLTAQEVERLIAAAKSRHGRYGHRDATTILIAYHHGLRWDMLDLTQGQLEE